MAIYDSHGVTFTATGTGDGNTAVVPSDRVYEVTFPSGTGELVDITVHTDTVKVTREPNFKSERPQMTIVTDFDASYGSIGGVGDYDFSATDIDGVSTPILSGTFQIVNMENSESFVAGETGLGKTTWTLEWMQDYVAPAP